MSLEGFKKRSLTPEVFEIDVNLTGTGASAPTVTEGPGITATRNGTGDYTLTFADGQSSFLGATYGLGADTPGDLAGHTLIVDSSAADGSSVTVNLYNASDTAHDLAASEHIYLTLKFQRSGL